VSGNAWGESWGIAGAFAWGDSWGFDAAVTPPTPEPDVPPPPSPGGAGGFSKAWSDHYRKPKKLTKKRKSLLEELDEMVIELRSRIREAPPEAAPPVPNFEIIMAESRMASELSNEEIKRQIARAQMMLNDMEDEELILLALH
jgi:hypothetical protein